MEHSEQNRIGIARTKYPKPRDILSFCFIANFQGCGVETYSTVSQETGIKRRSLKYIELRILGTSIHHETAPLAYIWYYHTDRKGSRLQAQQDYQSVLRSSASILTVRLSGLKALIWPTGFTSVNHQCRV